jgi:aminopeptidase-like protein/aminoglycoside N3'-acetyltransferase
VTSLAASPLAAQLIHALRDVGLATGDTVFVHVSLEALGVDRDTAPEHRARSVVDALREVVGPEGSLLLPTYTFSFCRQELYDVQETPTQGGPWSRSAEVLEYFRRLPGVVRSRDPIHSVAGLGPAASALLSGLPPTCFGPGSLYDRLRAAGAKICLLGPPLEEAVFRHHVEELVGVPFRFHKLFTGRIRDRGVTRQEGWLYYVRIMAPNGFPDGRRLEELARDAGVCRASRVGTGEVLAVECPAFFDFTAEQLRRDRWLTARGPAGDPVRLEDERVGSSPPAVRLPREATMGEMIQALWRLPRDIVSDGYDAALAALATQVPMTIHAYPTGLECWTWIVPEKWTCHEAYLETLDGRRLFSYADNPLHVVSYSLPFAGEVGREELFRHLHVHPQLPDAVPFVFKYYQRDWGLCCSRELRDGLTDQRYRVVIRSDFSYGTLKVGEVVVPGRSPDTIVLCAHLCHPGMVNDDLTGVVVGIDVMRRLLEGPTPRFTYQFLIVPETIGSVAHLSQHPELLPRLKGGLFLEMLGREHSHALQLSFDGRSAVDRCFGEVLRRHSPAGWTTPFRTLAGNDERQFNAPGVRVPMLALTRQLPPADPDFPYREYHSSRDVPDLVPAGSLEASRDLVLRMLRTLDADRVPRNRFQGEVFCSRYGIHVDPFENPEGNQALFDIMFLIDGTRSVGDIAETCGISFEAVQGTVEELRRQGLVEYTDA